MDNQDQKMATAFGSWAVAALAAGIAWILLMLLGGWTFMQATFVAIIIFVIVFLLALWIMRPLPPLGAPKKDDTPAKPVSKPAAAASAPVTTPSAAVAASAAAPATKAAPSKAAKAAPAKKAPAKKAAAKKAPAKKPVAADGKPELFTAPQGDADDLKLISGVGPKLEGTLNEMGIWHFSQVASWRKKEIAWVDERLKFKGRIERDDWISQAKILAKGGETEFSSRKKK